IFVQIQPNKNKKRGKKETASENPLKAILIWIMQETIHILQKEFDNLNPEQKRAALHTTGPALVLAGAGSGKTKVVAVRIGCLIHQGVASHQILGLTFTNKAANEMKERVHKLVGENV